MFHLTPPWRTVRAIFRPWAVLAVLLAAAGVSGWILYGIDFDAPAPARGASDAPDAWMESFVTVEMDGAGRPQRRIEARRMTYHADATIELSDPYYVLYRAEGEPWNVRSERGRVSADGTTVRLLGRVDIWRDDGSGGRALDVRTGHLTMLPDSEYGETMQPVTILMPSSTTTGIGMHAYLDEDRIELLSQVRTHVDRRRSGQ